MTPKVGNWYVEVAKNTRLYCRAFDKHRVQFSYSPTSPIAVTPTRQDFRCGFQPAPKLSAVAVAKYITMNLQRIAADPDLNTVGQEIDRFYNPTASVVEGGQIELRYDCLSQKVELISLSKARSYLKYLENGGIGYHDYGDPLAGYQPSNTSKNFMITSPVHTYVGVYDHASGRANRYTVYQLPYVPTVKSKIVGFELDKAGARKWVKLLIKFDGSVEKAQANRLAADLA